MYSPLVMFLMVAGTRAQVPVRRRVLGHPLWMIGGGRHAGSLSEQVVGLTIVK